MYVHANPAHDARPKPANPHYKTSQIYGDISDTLHISSYRF